MSDFFSEMAIQSLDGSEYEMHENVETDLIIKLNEGTIKTWGGIGNNLIVAGGVNKQTIRCFGLANFIRNEFIGQKKVNISLINPELRIDITEALISKQNNDVIISNWKKGITIEPITK